MNPFQFSIGYCLLTNFFPIYFGSVASIGYYDFDRDINISNSGWISSMGLNGMIKWDGSFFGNLPVFAQISLGLYEYYYGMIHKH